MRGVATAGARSQGRERSAQGAALITFRIDIVRSALFRIIFQMSCSKKCPCAIISCPKRMFSAMAGRG
jgi:hypothetical protein